jgi:hypothetical protein
MYYVWQHNDGTLGATFDPRGVVKVSSQTPGYKLLAQYPNSEWRRCEDFLNSPNLPLMPLVKDKGPAGRELAELLASTAE